MGSGNLTSIVGFAGPGNVDLRQPLLSHLTKVTEDILTEEAAATLLTRLAAARNDPVEVRRLISEALDGADAPLVRLVRGVLELDEAGTEIAWLPLEAMIKKSENCVVQGFKGTTELDNWFQRWKAWHTEAGRPLNDLTPKNFIDEMRLDQALVKAPDGTGIGFTNPVAHQAYRRWVLARVRKASGDSNIGLGDLDDSHFLAHTADVYMKHMAPGRRPAAAIEALFGPSPMVRSGRHAITGAPGPDKSDWAKIFGRVWRDPEADWLRKVKDLLGNQPELQRKVRAAFDRRFPDGAPPDPGMGDLVNMAWDERIPLWVNDAILNHIERSGALVSDLGDNILLDQLIRESLDSPQGDEVLTRLLGKSLMGKGIHSDEFVERLIDSYLVFGAIAVDMNIPWGHAAYARLGGMFELVQKGMSRSGTMRGYAFELEVIYHAIKAHSHNADIVLQFKINNLDGPDLLLVTATKVEVKQMKAYKSISALYHVNGEAARQTGSDIRRFMDEYLGDLDELAQGTGPIDWPSIPIEGHGSRQLDNTWTFFVDGRRTPGGLSARVQDNLADQATTLNAMLTNTAQATDENVADILAKSTEKLVKNSSETIADKKTLAMGRADPPLSVAQVALLRMFMKEHMGTLSDDALEALVTRARVASRLNPPIQIAFDVRTIEHLNAASHASKFAGLNTVGN